MRTVARAPGRVNLMGDHTDYTGGLVLPMAIDRWTTVRLERGGPTVHLTSAGEDAPADVPLDIADAATIVPPWARYVAGVVAELQPAAGGRGTVETTVPVGAGLSSSAALEVAVALALIPDWLGRGPEPTQRLALAGRCQAAEHRATGVPTGIMDQLASAAGKAGHALMIDCHTLAMGHVALPEAAEVVVRFVQHRTLVGSEYADRVAECAAAEDAIGALRSADPDAVEQIRDPVIRARARHVVTENGRVRAFSDALARGDLPVAGRLMTASHASLRDDYDCSTPVMDAAVADLERVPGVFGARMTGGGFGGCVVALTRPGALTAAGEDGWVVRAVDGAEVQDR